MEMVKLEDLKKMERRGVLYRDFSYGFITTEDIKKLEVIDAEPVRHGHWLPNEHIVRNPFFTIYRCSLCDYTGYYTKYCPNCGAKMYEEVIGDEQRE